MRRRERRHPLFFVCIHGCTAERKDNQNAGLKLEWMSWVTLKKKREWKINSSPDDWSFRLPPPSGLGFLPWAILSNFWANTITDSFLSDLKTMWLNFTSSTSQNNSANHLRIVCVSVCGLRISHFSHSVSAPSKTPIVHTRRIMPRVMCYAHKGGLTIYPRRPWRLGDMWLTDIRQPSLPV